MRSVREKPPHELNSTQKVSVRSVCSVREKTLQRERKNLYEVCKQPNRGNLTYHAPPCGGGVGGGATVLWVRNCAQKVPVRSVCSVREKTLQRERKNLYEVCKQPNRGNLTYYAPRHSERGWG